MSDAAEAVLFEVADHVARLTINRAEARNALSPAVVEGLTNGMRRVQGDADIRAIMITGAGDRAFCAGGDLKPGATSPFNFDYSRPSSDIAQMLHVATDSSVPLIARVNGHCLAGGMALLSMCDLAVASSTATFGLPEVKIGMFPMQVGAVLQPLIPRRKMMEMCLTGDPLSAQEALEMDLVNYVVAPDALDAKTDWLLQRVCSKSPTAVRRGRFAMAQISDMNTHQAIEYMATQLSTLAMTQDATEGLASFREKRQPKWSGK